MTSVPTDLPLLPNPPNAHLLMSQDESNDINTLISEINNPRLLDENPPSSTQNDNKSPSSSPASKKPKPSTSPQKEKEKPTELMSAHKKRSKKRSSSSTTPASVLKPSRYSGPAPAAQPEPLHSHKHSNVLIDLSIDFNKDDFNQFDGDSGKKMAYAIQQLIVNLKIADKYAVINPAKDPSEEPSLGGISGTPAPSNMTALSNYVKGLNPRAFQLRSGATDAQDTPGPAGTCRSSAQAYRVISISCDKDPALLINQISYEWARFGHYLKIKELQVIETSTPYAIYFVYALTLGRHLSMSKGTFSRKLKRECTRRTIF
jgi:hypothetical protein